MELIILMFLPFFIFLLSGVPIAYSLASISFLLLLKEGISPILVTQRMLASVDSFPLIAITLFILAGHVMNIAGITDRLFSFANSMVGRFRGGLAYVNILVSMIFAGMSGAAAADAAGLGLIEIKAMRERGYDLDFSVAVTAASAIIGPIIPPSIIMVVYGITAETSIGRLFLGGIFPGVIFGLSEMALCYYIAVKNNYPREKRYSFTKILQAFKEAFLPLLTPIIIIGGIVFGIFTPTEASSIAVIYAAIIGFFVYKKIKLPGMFYVIIQSMKDSAGIIFIIATAGAYSYLLSYYRFPYYVADLVVSIVKSPTIFIIVINMVFFILGCFLDANSIIIMVIPVILPILKNFGIDLTYFGIITTLSMSIAMITPPVGVVLYVMCTITDITLERYTKAMMPFFLLLFCIMLILIFLPNLLLFIPNLFLP